MSIFDRKELPMLITGFFGTLILFEYYLDIGPINSFATLVLKTTTIISTFAYTYGALNAVLHYSRLMLKSKTGDVDWLTGAWAVTVFVIMAGAGLLPPLGKNVIFNWIFSNIILVGKSTIYSLLAFWISSAAYRVFRMRNLESTILLVSALIVMLGQTPAIGVFFPPILELRMWLFNVPTKGGMRSIAMAFGLGATIAAIRTFLGQEKGFLLGGDGE